MIDVERIGVMNCNAVRLPFLNKIPGFSKLHIFWTWPAIRLKKRYINIFFPKTNAVVISSQSRLNNIFDLTPALLYNHSHQLWNVRAASEVSHSVFPLLHLQSWHIYHHLPWYWFKTSFRTGGIEVESQLQPPGTASQVAHRAADHNEDSVGHV